MSFKLFTAIVLGVTVSPFGGQVFATEVSKHLSSYIEPEPIKRVEPKYPIDAAREGREGWTNVSFVIDEKGDVSDVLLMESSGSKDIDKASLKAVSKWKYKPAFENGKPIQQCVNSVQMQFSLASNSNQGVSRSFKRQYRAGLEALEAKDHQAVEKQLNAMKTKKNMHLTESNYMHLLAARYEKEKQDKEKQLEHLNRVMVHTDATTEKLKLSVLYQRFILQAELNLFRDAYRSYKALMKLDSAQAYKADLDNIIANIDEVISSDKDIILQAKIKEDHWRASIVRNEFSLVDIKGALYTLDVRCANKRELFTVENNNTWTIPNSWKHCQIYVFGEKGSEFYFVEHPLEIAIKAS